MTYSPKMLHVDFSTLAYDRAFDFIPSQDPNVSMRVYLPVGNWLRNDGFPSKKWDHPNIFFHEGKKAFRFRFYNHKDKRGQDVAIDGTGLIAINGMNEDMLRKLNTEVVLTTGGVHSLNGNDLLRLMTWMQIHFQIGDFYNTTTEAVAERMWAYKTPRSGVYFGGFIPKPHVSAAIGYKGPVTFEVLPGQPQVHKNGGFVTFPTLSAEDIRMAGKDGIFALCAERKVTPRAVEAGVMRLQNSLPDGKPIPVPTFRPWFRARKLG